MATFRFTQRAESDLIDINDHTFLTWGAAQTDRYLGELTACFQTLADNPAMGRLCEFLLPGMHRFERGMHVVFSVEHRRGILIARILHRSMLPGRHPLSDQEES
jgi:toxin ParE1/3/4